MLMRYDYLSDHPLRHFQALQQMYGRDLDWHTSTGIAGAGVVNRPRQWRAVA
jgi:hypothetical protein